MVQAQSTQQELEEAVLAEERLRFSDFSHANALRVLQLVLEEATRRETPVCVRITLSGRVVALHSCDGTTRDNDRWITLKERVTRLYSHSSYLIGLQLSLQGEQDISARGLPVIRYSASGGCFPLLLPSGVMIGQASVSGYTPRGDHLAIVHALEKLQKEIDDEWKNS